VIRFLGFWLGFVFFTLSFLKHGTSLQWVFFGIAMVAFHSGLGFSCHFANRPEVSEKSTKEPTGFKTDITSLHLEE
jgi:hypothetical protein